MDQSVAQLYLDFQLTTGSVGPAKLAQWCDGDDLQYFSLAEHPLRKRVRWFVKVFKETLRKCGQPVVSKYGLAKSNALLFHTGTISLPWPIHRVEMIDKPIGSMYAIYGNIYHQYTPNVGIYTIHGSYGKWLVQRIPEGVRRVSVRALDHLPIAGRAGHDDRFGTFYISPRRRGHEMVQKLWFQRP